MKRFDIPPEFKEVLEFLGAGGKHGYFWNSGGKMSSWYHTEDPVGFPQLWIDNGWNVYFGVNPSKVEKRINQRVELSDIASIRTFFAEFDAKDYGTIDDIRDHIANIVNRGLPEPSMIINSGAGIHAYWFLKEPLPVEASTLKATKCKLYAWIEYVGGDIHSKDLCRVLRVPGTYNYKYGEPIKVEIEELNLDLQYDAADLLTCIGYDYTQEDCAEPERVTYDVPIIDDERLRKFCLAGLAGECGIVEDTKEGSRNTTLFKSACSVGQLVATGGLSEDEAEGELLQAARACGLTDGEALPTIRSGLKHGIENPREIKHTKEFLEDRAADDPYGDYDLFISNFAAYLNYFKRNEDAKAKAAKPTHQDIILPAWLDVEENDLLFSELNRFPVSDEGNAQAMLYVYPGRFAHNGAFGWMAYDGRKWIIDGATQIADRAATNVLLWRQKAALISADLSPKMFPQNRKLITPMLKQLESIVFVPVERFDRKVYFLNAANGLVDLRTGEIHPHQAEHYLTHCLDIPYNPDADPSEFHAWVSSVCGEVQADWLKKYIGYMTNGVPREETLLFLYGPSRSGKGTFTETISACLGKPLTTDINFSSLVETRGGDSQNFDLAELTAARLVFANEGKEHEKMNGAKLKLVTGGGAINCAKKHQQPFTYVPMFAIILSSNYLPNISPDDEAAWGRTRIVEFLKSYLGEEDKELKGRMKERSYLEGVLAWIIQGAISYNALGKAGLVELQQSKMMKNTQVSLLDNVAAWMDECVIVTGQDSDFASAADCMTSYVEWCKANGVTAKTSNGLARSMEKRKLTMPVNCTYNAHVRGVVRPDGSRKTTRGYKGLMIA